MSAHEKPLDDQNFISTTTDNQDFSVNKYDSCLGHGAFGIVLKAVTNSSERPVAVKFLFLSADVDERERKLIARESNTTINLEKHENVVQIISAIQKDLTVDDIQSIFSDDILQNEEEKRIRDERITTAKRTQIQAMCITMELCGENLRMWLEGHEDQDSKDIYTQLQQMLITNDLMAGLKHLHDNNIIHRDLKPENIMFSSEKYHLPVKIGDFGLCRKLPDEGTQTGSLTSNVGTRSYMAPEVRSGSKQYSYQADLYSLGLIIWQVLQFVKPNLFEQLVYDNKTSLVKEYAIIGGVKKVIIGLTKRNPEKRFERLDDLVELSDSLGEIARTRNIMHAKNSAEFRFCLEHVKPGCAILLTKGIFVGQFILKHSNISIRGVPGTVMESENDICLHVRGNNCFISNVKMVAKVGIGIRLTGTGNVIKNVEITGRDCIVVDDDSNRLENLIIRLSTSGIIMNGSSSTINNVQFADIEKWGLMIAPNSDGNIISNIYGSNVAVGIAVHGSGNKFSDISFTKIEGSNFFGIELCSSGSNNTIEKLICEDYAVDNKDWGLRICSNNTKITESKCGPLYVIGDNNELTNVDCGELTRVEGDAKGLNLTNCRGIKIELKTLLKNMTPSKFNYENVDWLKDEQVFVPIHSTVPIHAVEKVARNSEELKMCLESAENGCLIILDEGIYCAPFELKQNNVTIVGKCYAYAE